jgi:hypothetical protein
LSTVLASAAAALLLTACASSSEPTRVYQPRPMKTGSNIDPGGGADDASTDADRQRARDEAQSIRDNQNRRNMPRQEGMPKS